MRALRWRRRWGGRHGRIRVREDVPMEERRAKVARQKGAFLQFPGSKSSPESGPDFRPGIRAQFWDRNPDPKSGPDSGP